MAFSGRIGRESTRPGHGLVRHAARLALPRERAAVIRGALERVFGEQFLQIGLWAYCSCASPALSAELIDWRLGVAADLISDPE
jgi:hypothetical protein